MKLLKGVTIVKNKNWKYKIGVDTFSFVPLTISLIIFGGVTFWLKIADNGIFLFTGFISALLIIIALYNLYRLFASKLLISEDGFYHQTHIGNGKFYKYLDIEEAWISEGRSVTGVINKYLNYRTFDGTVVKYYFTSQYTDEIEYLVSQISKESDNQNEE